MSDAIATPAATTPAQTGIARLAPWGVWLVLAVVLAALPLLFRSGTALTMLSLMGIAIIFALSYNMLLGQTGMLSFGHAVYYGLGAYFTVHAINWAIAAKLPIPLLVMPLVGGFAGLVFAIVFGWVSTKRSGTAFAMISLGLAELVGSSSLILRSFFGGEEGVTTNRTKLLRLFDWNFGPQIQVYYLIAGWCLLSIALMYALTRTPWGRMCNAVRDNSERAQFVGYNPQVVRYIAFCLSGLFAGVAGGLASINFELANSALFSAAQSGNVLLATFIGGAGHFVGPILGAVLVTYLQNMLSDVTEVWQLYFGLMFIATVMYAPGGLAGLIMMHGPIWRAGALSGLAAAYALLLAPIALVAVGAVLVIEMMTHLGVKAAEGTVMKMAGISFDARSGLAWALALGLLLAGGGLALLAWRGVVAPAWDRAQAKAREKGLTL
ncbi:MAG TPA: branched-chain amino acid ABC transporter permease [Hyphomicrobiaceae bacterium]|nr:branched-chain amino acid ABC transporter permease [Hyphomicrobiaceae bacterium]